LDVPLAELRQHEQTAAAPGPQRVATLEDAEREHIRQALEAANWQVGGASGAATRLGMKRTTLQSKMAKLGIAKPARPAESRTTPI
jgi:formate hydrogenlyase transcriptional activator